MRIMTIFGTRPEIIRLSLVAKMLDKFCDHITVHTGQNYDESLSDIFIRDLEMRTPNVHFGIRSSSFGEQAGLILQKTDAVLEEFRPDRVLILGDTNSALSAIVAARRGIPVYHMEAGNRCFDNRVPEEINRRIIDHSSTILLPYTARSCENLVAEGIERDRVYITGNPIFEVLEHFAPEIDRSEILNNLQISPSEFFLVTLHRAENVDLEDRLERIFKAFHSISIKYGKKVLVSVHPRTRQKLLQFKTEISSERIMLLEPLGFFDFVKLQKNAFCVLSDSGTVQEECSIFGIPNVTLRDVTERPETVECGSNIIAGSNIETIETSVDIAVSQLPNWTPPAEYSVQNVAQIVSRIVLSRLSLRSHH